MGPLSQDMVQSDFRHPSDVQCRKYPHPFICVRVVDLREHILRDDRRDDVLHRHSG